MFYPDKLKDFVEMTSIFAGAVSYLDTVVSEYDSLISEKAGELMPFLIDSQPLLIEYYSTPEEKLYSDIRDEIEEVEKNKFCKEEFKNNISALLSDGPYGSLFSQSEDELQAFAKEQLPDLIACLRLCLMNFKSIVRNKTTINRLIVNGSNGDDESLFIAIKIDPIVERVPVVSQRIDVAHSLGEVDFLNRLNKARSVKKDDKRLRNQTLDYFLVLYHITGVLGQLTSEQLAHIFINELRIYDKEDESLRSYIRRWRKEYNRYLLRVKTQLSNKSSA